MWWFSSRRGSPPAQQTEAASGAAGQGDGAPAPPPPPPPPPRRGEGGGSRRPAAETEGLDAIVAAVLQAVTEGQQASNGASAQIARAHLSDPLLGSFRVPNAVVDSVALTLNFGIRKTAAKMTEVSGHPRFDRDRLRAVCRDAALLACQAAAEALRAPPDPPHGPAAGPAAAQARQEAAATVATTAFSDWLADERMVPALERQAPRLIAADGTVDTAAVEAALRETARRVLDEHPDVVELLPPDAASLVPGFHGIAAPLGKAGAVVVPRASRPATGMEVVIDADALAELPPESIQTITLTVHMRSFGWVADPSGERRLVSED